VGQPGVVDAGGTATGSPDRRSAGPTGRTPGGLP
jgi:hypothetical protein